MESIILWSIVLFFVFMVGVTIWQGMKSHFSGTWVLVVAEIVIGVLITWLAYPLVTKAMVAVYWVLFVCWPIFLVAPLSFIISAKRMLRDENYVLFVFSLVMTIITILAFPGFLLCYFPSVVHGLGFNWIFSLYRGLI